jgi:hypothetical protein
MEDQELERRLSELKGSWRIPRDPPLDQIWQAVEAKAFPTALPHDSRRWTRTLLPLAAMLLLGFGLGRLIPAGSRTSPAPAAGTGGVSASAAAEAIPARLIGSEEPFVGIATNYLERVTALLVALADANRRGQPPEHSTVQARDLLTTTRLLLDSQRSDPHLQELLGDLELVLAQIVRLPQRAAPPDVYFIDQTLDQREVLPRLRELLAENSTQP